MRVERADLSDKGWYLGPWNSDLAVSIGYANGGIDQPHVHTRVTEVYLVARGTAVVRIEREEVVLQSGDVLAVEPGEAHTFLSSSSDYFHFVLHVPGSASDETRKEKEIVSRARLGL